MRIISTWKRVNIAAVLGLALAIGGCDSRVAPVSSQPTASGETVGGETVDTTANATNTAVAAQASFERMLQAYRDARSFSATVALEARGEGAPAAAGRLDIAFQAPARLKITLEEENGRTALGADGTHFYTIPAGETTYQKMPLPPVAEFGRKALMQYPLVPIIPLLAGVNPLQAPWGEAPDSLRMKPNEVVDGKPVEVVEAVWESGPMTRRTQYAIAQDDHLLRRLTTITTLHSTDGTTAPQTVTTIDTYREIEVDAPLAPQTLALTPSAGTTAVDPAAQAQNPPFKLGQTPPSFATRDLSGRAVQLQDYKGKVVLLDFWASWCQPCLEEMPFLRDVRAKYGDQGFEIVGFSNDYTREALTKYLQDNALPWRQVWDRPQSSASLPTAEAQIVSELYQVDSLPFALLLGRDGKIVAISPRRLMLEAAVRKALAEPNKS